MEGFTLAPHFVLNEVKSLPDLFRWQVNKALDHRIENIDSRICEFNVLPVRKSVEAELDKIKAEYNQQLIKLSGVEAVAKQIDEMNKLEGVPAKKARLRQELDLEKLAEEKKQLDARLDLILKAYPVRNWLVEQDSMASMEYRSELLRERCLLRWLSEVGIKCVASRTDENELYQRLHEWVHMVVLVLNEQSRSYLDLRAKCSETFQESSKKSKMLSKESLIQKLADMGLQEAGKEKKQKAGEEAQEEDRQVEILLQKLRKNFNSRDSRILADIEGHRRLIMLIQYSLPDSWRFHCSLVEAKIYKPGTFIAKWFPSKKEVVYPWAPCQTEAQMYNTLIRTLEVCFECDMESGLGMSTGKRAD